MTESSETPGSNPSHPDGDTEAPEGKDSIQGHTVNLVPSWPLPPSGNYYAFTPASGPNHPAWLTLQLLVPSLPLNGDRGCPIMDEALEAGILALSHGTAGRVDGDDRAPKAWGTRWAEGWAQQGWDGSTSHLRSSVPFSPCHSNCHTHGRRTLHWVGQ